MPRIKKLAQKKKKKHCTDEASISRGAVRYLIGMSADHLPIYDKFRNSKIIRPNIVIDWDVLGWFNIRQEVEGLLHDPAWLGLFSIEEKI